MMDPSQHPIISLLILSVIFLIVKNVYNSLRSHLRARALGCQPGVYGPSGPFGLGFFMKIAKAAKEGNRIHLHDDLYKIHGNTFKQRIPGNEILFTIEPANAKAILTAQFEDFGLGHRAKTFWPLLGDGIFNADGHKWAHARTLLRPQFTKDQVADLQLMDEHIKTFIEAIPKDKSIFDIQPLFFAFTNSSSTHFLFGESLAGPKSSSGSGAAEFGRAFDKSLEWVSRRLSAQKLSFLVDGNKEYTSACKFVHDIADHYVRLALNARTESRKSSRYIFLQALADDTQDPKVLRDNILNLLIAGRDTTASLLSSVLFYLSHSPSVWKRLRQELIDEFGDLTHPTGEITHAKIKNLRYLRYVLNETLRLLPPVPINSRMALKDTSLPLGGGPDGKSPVFVKKGTIIPFSLYTMHRRKDIWGPDAEHFQPERWEKDGLVRTWEYIPFNGGPRICLGQQYALIEASYMLIRLVQNFDQLENDGGSPMPNAKVDLTLTHRNGVNVRLYKSSS
ncbi:putative N-alkane-inducible cytochrome P450 [Talaromyces proteolyticus]|uniref:N-alkane-inducible cytochrome P450 n=1 Tax=Talaromyces proteolyticus TaxID=1131652 RepID=A0AAD4KG04_9EURO|nr:putative N-alkane-inducible cytochrome P450 [Talaromyces proteolyticus]KAH8691453.1 putative N-alkane-inducible cytochrome P450 [Talaromyces proteolyticus]